MMDKFNPTFQFSLLCNLSHNKPLFSSQDRIRTCKITLYVYRLSVYKHLASTIPPPDYLRKEAECWYLFFVFNII